MALTAVETTLMGMFDRLAYLKAAYRQTSIGGTRMFARVDASANEAFELRLGQSAHDFDAVFGNETAAGTMDLQDMAEVRDLLDKVHDYVRLDLGGTTVDAYLTAQGWRVPLQVAEIMRARYGTVTAANVGGEADAGAAAPGLVLGDLTRGGALVAGTDMDDTLCGGAPILARVTVIGSSDWTLSVTVKLWDDTTKVISQVVLGTGNEGAAGDTYVIGAQAVGSEAASGQKVVAVAATGQFKAGQKVLLTEWTGAAPSEVWVQQEVATIDTIQANTSLTMLANLKHTYSTAAFVYPLAFGVSAASGSGGSASDRVYFYPAPDRRLKL